MDPLEERLEPPFGTSRQAWAFAALLAVVLLLPAATSYSGLVTRDHLYTAVPNEWGAFSFIHREIFERDEDLDMLVLGTSLLYQALDAPYLRDRLGERLGRPARVAAFGSNWRCEYLNYVLLRDVLARRRVKLLVFSMPVYYQHESLPHVQSYRWLLPGHDEEVLDGLPARNRATLYAEAVLGTPRHLLSLVRRDRARDDPAAASLGTAKIEKGIRPAGFVRWTPPPRVLPAASMIYSPGTAERFHFTGQAMTGFETHMLARIFELARDHGVPVVLVTVPTWVKRHGRVVEERLPWSEVFDGNISLVGVPPATLFEGMSEEEIARLFYNQYSFDNHHLSANGNEYFTRTIAPALLQLYADNVH